MNDFESALTKLCAAEIPHARRDPERLAAMIERLADSLALTLAVGNGGNIEQMEKMYAGCEQFILAMMTDYVRVGKIASGHP